MDEPKPMRWALTVGAYNKYAYIFNNELPCKVKVKSLSQVAVIRDVLTYARDNNLKGGEWCDKVKVTAVEGPAAYITNKANKSATLDIYSSKSLFEILELAQEGKLSGVTCYMTDGIDALADLAVSLNFTYMKQGNNLVSFT